MNSTENTTPEPVENQSLDDQNGEERDATTHVTVTNPGSLPSKEADDTANPGEEANGKTGLDESEEAKRLEAQKKALDDLANQCFGGLITKVLEAIQKKLNGQPAQKPAGQATAVKPAAPAKRPA